MDELTSTEEIEEAILGIMFNNSDSIISVLEKLTPEDFSKKINGKVFQVLIDIYNNDYSSADTKLVTIKLEEANLLESFGGREKIAQLAMDAPLSDNLEAYVDSLKDRSVKLKLKNICTEIGNEINRNYKSANDILDYSQAKIFSIEAEKNKNPIVSLKDLGKERMQRIIKIGDEGDKSYIGIPTNFRDYDKITGGLHGSDLIILAARPSVGKTAFAINLAYNVAKQNKKVLFFSLEMGNEQLYTRILALSSGIEARKIKDFNLNKEETLACVKTEEKIRNYPLYIAGDATVTVLEIKNLARRFKLNTGLDFIIIDYLQLINSISQNKQREQQVSEISRSLKLLAKELDVPILALSQLSRSVESRSDKRPMLSDLRESGAIEQDADQVIFLHREEYYGKDEKSDSAEEKKEFVKNLPNKVEVIIGKHRNGSTGTVFLSFDLAHQKFDNNIYTQGGTN